MARLKFLAFAVIALGLWGYHLALIAPLATSGALEQAQAAAAGAVGPIAASLESRRSLVQAVALKVVGGTAAWNPGPKAGAKPEAPTADRFAAVRAAASELVPAELKDQLFIALSNDVGVLAARGPGEPAASAPEGLALQGIIDAGASGAVGTLEGAAYFFVAVPMVISDKNEVKQAGSALVGLPLLPDVKVLEQLAGSLSLTVVALVADNKPVLTAGDKGALKALLALKPGETANLGAGPVQALGPLLLPLMTEAPHGAGTRQVIAGTPFDVVAAASARAGLQALAGYQVFALGGLGGLLLLALVVTIIIGGSEEQGAAMVMPPPMPLPPSQARLDSVPPKAAPLTMAEPAHAPEASPDDFDFPASSSSGMTGQNQAFQPSQPMPPPPVSTGLTGQNPLFEPEPTSDPFAQSAPPPPPPARAAPPPPPVATSEAPAYLPQLNEEDEAQRTVAYPAFKPPPGAQAAAPAPMADPFAMASAQQGYDEQSLAGEDNPESTRVAAVPAELLKAARAAGGVTSERPAVQTARPPTASMPKVASIAPAGGGGDEERHFQEVFRDFVSTREKCKEPADGLTFDKFKAKLLKNREQLVAKYNCKSVRFQVYVKDGKAALKATPVKD